MEKNKAIKLILLLITLFGKFSKCCKIENIVTTPYDPSTQPTTVNISWTISNDCQNVVKYKIFPKQLNYKACTGYNSRQYPEVRHASFESDVTKVTLRNLIPFSDYEVKILAVFETQINAPVEEVARFETPEGQTLIRPVRSEAHSVSFKQAIKFYWEKPSSEDCRFQNGKFDGYYIELRGQDPWVHDKLAFSKHLPETFNEYYVENLEPFTSYELRIHAKNALTSYNPEVFLAIRARTRANIPNPPMDIKVKAREDNVYVNWKPPYPPRGQVEHYVVRIGEVPGPDLPTIWKKRVEVPFKSDHLCLNEEFSNQQQIPTNWTVCTVIPDLEPNQYVLQVQTKNKKVDSPSDYSRSFRFDIRDPAAGEKSEGNYTKYEIISPMGRDDVLKESDEDANGSGQPETWVLVVGLLFAVVLIGALGAFLAYKIKVKRIKLEFQRQSSALSFGLNRHSSAGLTENSGVNYNASISGLTTVTDFSTVGRSSRNSGRMAQWRMQQQQRQAEIQSRRLPEPPPIETAIDEEEDEAETDNEYVDVMPKQSSPGDLVREILNETQLTRAEDSSHLSRTDSSDDIDGYLRPTFRRDVQSNLTSDPMFSSTPFRENRSKVIPNSNSSSSFIPTESYDQHTLNSHLGNNQENPQQQRISPILRGAPLTTNIFHV